MSRHKFPCTHGLWSSNRAEHRRWQDMLQRCENPRCKSFVNYGARGITVCERWHEFGSFLADMGKCNGLSLDRIDPNGNYEPTNCRWADATTQSRNTRRTTREGAGVRFNHRDTGDVRDLHEHFAEAIEDLRFVPDAYVINGDALDFFEVEVFSPMSAEKLRAYGKFAIDLAFYGVQFNVYTVNQHGHVHVVDLMPHYADWLLHASRGDVSDE